MWREHTFVTWHLGSVANQLLTSEAFSNHALGSRLVVREVWTNELQELVSSSGVSLRQQVFPSQ